MKFSIVTPTFNHKKYISTTIKSVLENKKHYPNVEYIIVDGNSTDGTQNIIRSYGDQIDLFISEPDEGQADAINKGFKHATGDIYAYINSDDYYYPDTFKKVAKIFEENPNIDVIYGNCTFVTEDEQFYRYFTEIEPYDEYRLRSCTDFIMQPACFWRKEIYDRCGGFTKQFHFGFDWEMWCRMTKQGAKFYYERDLFAVNREFEETKTQTGGKKRLEELKRINKLHKMSVLPYAYYSYTQGELKTKYPDITSSFKKFITKLKIYFYRFVSLPNLTYHQTNFHKQNLYGINHHTPILEKNAQISFPYYKNDKNPYLIIVLQSTIAKQSVEININGNETIKSHFKNNSTFLICQLKELTVHNIDIKFSFSKEVVKIFGLKNRFLYRRVKYSGAYAICNIYTKDEFEAICYKKI